MARHSEESNAARRRLIVTADDLGASREVNEAVVRAHREGVLRFASLMVGEEAAREAVDRVKRECPGLGVGLHLTLCSGRSVLGFGRVPGLVDADGCFSDDPVRCGLRYFFETDLRGYLEAEMRAQFERFLGFGLPPAHVDGHVNIHMHPVVFPLLVRLAREYGFKRVRATGGEMRAHLSNPGVRALPQRLIEGGVFAWMRRYLLRAWGDSRLEVPDRVYGLLRSGLMKEDYVVSCLKALPPGTTEMYFHPSADPATAVGDRPAPTHRSYSELQTLLSPRVREVLEVADIELVSGT